MGCLLHLDGPKRPRDVGATGARMEHPVIGTEARVVADIAARQARGLAKYGTTVEANPLTLRQWLQHAYEECLDQAVYLRRAIEEIDKTRDDGK